MRTEELGGSAYKLLTVLTCKLNLHKSRCGETKRTISRL